MNTNAELLRELRIDRSAAPPPRRKGPWIAAGIAALAIVLAVAGWMVFGRDDAIPVETTFAVPMASGGAPASVLDASGYVVARRMATVSAKVTGRVREVLIEEGMRVEQGQVLARLDPVDAEQQRALAASQLEAARSQLGAVEAQLKEAEANAVRLETLAAQKLVPQAQYEQAVAQRDSLRSQLATARRNVQVAADGLRIAEQGIENTIVVAPFSGVITAKAAQEGEIVSPLSAGGGFTRTGIGTIVDMDSLEVEVDVGEAYIGRVQPKMPVEAVLNSYPDWKIPAEVIAIIPAADRGKATVKVRIALKEKDPRIVPDMGVRVSFLEPPKADEEKPEGVRVPADALVERDGRTVVFVVGDDGRVALREVATGSTLGRDRQVLSGLSPGDEVVLDPPAGLHDGARVRRAPEDTGN